LDAAAARKRRRAEDERRRPEIQQAVEQEPQRQVKAWPLALAIVAAVPIVAIAAGFSVEGISIMLIVGVIAGCQPGRIGFGFGVLWDIVIGIVGAFIGGWLFRRLGFMPFNAFVGSIVNATIGAVILLVISRLAGPLTSLPFVHDN
jgi:uncharacterized membrane protein YeaQ/YmgE (transglycosylase-associated protein family)